MRPGINIAIRNIPPSRQALTNTGVWFVAGLTEKGDATEPIRVTSLAEYEQKCGTYVSYGFLYDALDVFFREGGSVAYIARVLGAGALKSFITLKDASVADTLKVEANSPGDWGNALNIQVVAGAAGYFILVVSHDTLGELERSPELLDKTAALNWANTSNYVDLTSLASLNDPAVVASTSLSSGTDDRVSINDPNWEAALTKFSRDLGPGQVSMPGRTTSAAHGDLIEHGAANNRSPLLDAPDSNVKATLLAATTPLYSPASKWAAIFGRWLIAPGTVPSTLRTVPPSALVAGAIARNDAAQGNSNTPAAGINGQAQYVSALTGAQPTDLDLEALNAAGFNSIITKYGGVRIYGWRSLANPSSESAWVNWGNSRLIMEISSKADEIAEAFLFDEIDGQGRKLSEFGGALTGMLIPYWSQGSLYGAVADEAFQVDVGPGVNTPTTIANHELRAVILLRPSPFAEMITIELVKAQVTDNT